MTKPSVAFTRQFGTPYHGLSDNVPPHEKETSVWVSIDGRELSEAEGVEMQPTSDLKQVEGNAPISNIQGILGAQDPGAAEIGLLLLR